MAAPAPDIARLDTRFPPQQFGFDLREEPGCNPPAGVVALRGRDRVQLRLSVGAHYFFTCMSSREPDFSAVQEFLDSTVSVTAPHQFLGEGFSDDGEWNSASSARYAKLAGIAFMAEHAASTWFARVPWKTGVAAGGDSVGFSKIRPGDFGPDFLAAPFDPVTAGIPDPFYAIEFKGRGGKVAFTSPCFATWRDQALNINCTDRAGTARTIKSWVLAFNYAFEHGKGDRGCSTLLVDDPKAGLPHGEPLQPSRAAIEGIVREHLSRQCGKLGASMMSGPVLAGRPVSRGTLPPPVYHVAHPRLRDRRYIGWFGCWGPKGEIIWSSAPLGAHSLAAAGLVVVDVRSTGGGLTVRARARGRPGPAVNVEVSVQSVHGLATQHEVERWVRALLGSGPEAGIFVGQDANMLRSCVSAPRGQPLTDAPFTDVIELVNGDTDSDFPYAIQVLRNGGLIASAAAVQPVEDPDGWWAHRAP